MTNKLKEDWIKTTWRPMMGWMYLIVCVFDFIVFPIGFTIVQFWEVEASNDAFRQWSPLTLQGAGLFHMAMGAVLGIAAWSRGQEKIAGANTGYMSSTYQSERTFESQTPIEFSKNSKKKPVQEDEPEL